MEENFASDLKITEVKQHNLFKAYEQINSQASSILLLGVQWKDLEEHFDSIRKSIENRLLEFEEREKVVRSMEADLSTMRQMVVESSKEVAMKEEELSSEKDLMEKRNFRVAMKEEELRLERVRVERLLSEIGAKEKGVELWSRRVEERGREVELKEKEVVKRSTVLIQKAKELESAKELIAKCNEEFLLKEKELSFMRERIDGFTREIKEKEMNLNPMCKKLKDCEGKFELKKKELAGILELIKERSEELDSKKNEVNSFRTSIKEHSEELGSKEKQIRAIQKAISDSSIEVKSKEMEIEKQSEVIKWKRKKLDWVERSIKTCSKELESKKAELDSMGGRLKKFSEDIVKKESEIATLDLRIEGRNRELETKKMHIEQHTKELKNKKYIIEECNKEVDMKEKELDSILKLVTECNRDLELIKEQLNSVWKLMVECSNASEHEQDDSMDETTRKCLKELKLREDNFEFCKKAIQEESLKLELEKREFERRVLEHEAKEKLMHSSMNEKAKDIELKEQNVNSLKKSIEERCQELEVKEKQYKERVKQLESIEKQFRMPQEIANNVPNLKVKTEQLESGPAINALIHCCSTDSKALLLILYDYVDHHAAAHAKVASALQKSSDPAKLVLDAIQVFYSRNTVMGDTEVNLDLIRKSCIILLEKLMRVAPKVTPQVREEALKLATEWKKKLELPNKTPLEALEFLQLLSNYELTSDFNADELQSLYDFMSQRNNKDIHVSNHPSVSIKEGQPHHVPSTSAPVCSSSNLQLNAATERGGVGLKFYLLEQLHAHEISSVLQMAWDPAKFVLDLIQRSFSQHRKSKELGFELSLATNCTILFEELMRVSPHIEPQVKEDAAKLAFQWKEKMNANTNNGLEVVGFLQMLAMYGLASHFKEDEIMKYLEIIAQHKQAPDLCQRLGFTQKIQDRIQSFLGMKQFIEAVRFVCAFKLEDKFQPTKILNDYIEEARKSSGRHPGKRKSFEESVKAWDEEIDALKAMTGCIVDCGLESEFPSTGLEARIALLEKLKAERNSTSLDKTILKKEDEKKNSTSPHKKQKPNEKSSVPTAPIKVEKKCKKCNSFGSSSSFKHKKNHNHKHGHRPHGPFSAVARPMVACNNSVPNQLGTGYVLNERQTQFAFGENGYGIPPYQQYGYAPNHIHHPPPPPPPPPPSSTVE